MLIPPTPSGAPTLIYASNRNIGTEDPAGDTIAIVQFTTQGNQSSFKIVKQVPTGLQQIRGMAFSDDGQFLVAGGSKSGGIKVFQRINDGTDLKFVAADDTIDTRTSFVWVSA